MSGGRARDYHGNRESHMYRRYGTRVAILGVMVQRKSKNKEKRKRGRPFIRSSPTSPWRQTAVPCLTHSAYARAHTHTHTCVYHVRSPFFCLIKLIVYARYGAELRDKSRPGGEVLCFLKRVIFRATYSQPTDWTSIGFDWRAQPNGLAVPPPSPHFS